MLTTLLFLAAAPDPAAACLPVPEAISKLGDEAVTAYRDELAKTDPKAPKLTSAPDDARLLLKVIWTAAGKKEPLKALRPFMEEGFTPNLAGDAAAEKRLPSALKAALKGDCKATETELKCAAKKGPAVKLEKKDACWRWTAFE